MKFLNQPITVNHMELKNRLVMPPMATAKSAPDGRVTDPLCDYYDEKSAGGDIGLIITEHSYVAPEGKASRGQLSIAVDSDVEGLKRLTDVIHRNESRVFAQINHAGAAASREITGCEVIGAYVAQQLSTMGFSTTNLHKTSYVISPEFDSAGQMVVRDNIKPMLKDKHILVVLASAMSGHTIMKSIRCIESYGGIMEGISVIFGAVSEIEGYPVNAVFSLEDIPDFRLSDPHDCPDCKAGIKLDAIVNSYGYTTLD